MCCVLCAVAVCWRVACRAQLALRQGSIYLYFHFCRERKPVPYRPKRRIFELHVSQYLVRLVLCCCPDCDRSRWTAVPCRAKTRITSWTMCGGRWGLPLPTTTTTASSASSKLFVSTDFRLVFSLRPRSICAPDTSCWAVLPSVLPDLSQRS